MKKFVILPVMFLATALAAHPGHEQSLLHLIQEPFAGVEHIVAALAVAGALVGGAIGYALAKRRRAPVRG